MYIISHVVCFQENFTQFQEEAHALYMDKRPVLLPEIGEIYLTHIADEDGQGWYRVKASDLLDSNVTLNGLFIGLFFTCFMTHLSVARLYVARLSVTCLYVSRLSVTRLYVARLYVVRLYVACLYVAHLYDAHLYVTCLHVAHWYVVRLYVTRWYVLFTVNWKFRKDLFLVFADVCSPVLCKLYILSETSHVYF